MGPWRCERRMSPAAVPLTARQAVNLQARRQIDDWTGIQTRFFFCFFFFFSPINTSQRGKMVLQRLKQNWALPGFSPFLCYLGADYDNNNKSVINKNKTKGLNKGLRAFTVEIMKLISTFQCWHLELLKPIVCVWAGNAWFERWQPWIQVNQKRLKSPAFYTHVTEHLF